MINATPHKPGQQWSYRYEMHEAGALPFAVTIRERLGHLLLRSAKWLLGGYVVHFSVQTSPGLRDSDVKRCLLVGFKESERILKVMTEHQATDALFRKTHAWLFEEKRN